MTVSCVFLSTRKLDVDRREAWNNWSCSNGAPLFWFCLWFWWPLWDVVLPSPSSLWCRWECGNKIPAQMKTFLGAYLFGSCFKHAGWRCLHHIIDTTIEDWFCSCFKFKDASLLCLQNRIMKPLKIDRIVVSKMPDDLFYIMNKWKHWSSILKT